VTPKGLTSNNYNITFAKGTLSVTKAPLTVTADNKSKVYGAANPNFTVSTTASSTAMVPRAWVARWHSTRTLTPASPVALRRHAQGPDLGNYNISFAKGTLTVTKADLTVTADNKSKVYGAANPTFHRHAHGREDNDGITASYGLHCYAAECGWHLPHHAVAQRPEQQAQQLQRRQEQRHADRHQGRLYGHRG
jgi:hypothetical protein